CPVVLLHETRCEQSRLGGYFSKPHFKSRCSISSAPRLICASRVARCKTNCQQTKLFSAARRSVLSSGLLMAYALTRKHRGEEPPKPLPVQIERAQAIDPI